MRTFFNILFLSKFKKISVIKDTNFLKIIAGFLLVFIIGILISYKSMQHSYNKINTEQAIIKSLDNSIKVKKDCSYR
jgi:hypothetical protein